MNKFQIAQAKAAKMAHQAAHQAAIECEAARKRHEIASEEYAAITEQVVDTIDAAEAKYDAMCEAATEGYCSEVA